MIDGAFPDPPMGVTSGTRRPRLIGAVLIETISGIRTVGAARPVTRRQVIFDPCVSSRLRSPWPDRHFSDQVHDTVGTSSGGKKRLPMVEANELVGVLQTSFLNQAGGTVPGRCSTFWSSCALASTLATNRSTRSSTSSSSTP
jgi:hypothetical protein